MVYDKINRNQSNYADVAELVDALDLGSSRFPVRVQVPLSVISFPKFTFPLPTEGTLGP